MVNHGLALRASALIWYMSLALTFRWSEQVTWPSDISGSEKPVESRMHPPTMQS